MDDDAHVEKRKSISLKSLISTLYLPSPFTLSLFQDVGGSNLITTTTREETIYHLQTTRDHLEKGMSVLGQVTTSQAFKVGKKLA